METRDNWLRKVKGELRLLPIAIFITALSLIIPGGYQVFTGDLLLYMPSLYHSLNHNLFQNDLLLSFNQTSYTLFDDVIIFLTNNFSISTWFKQDKAVNIFYIFFLLTIVVRLIFLYSIHTLVSQLTGKLNFIIVLILLLTLTSSVYGTATSVFSNYLHPRFVGFSINLFFLVCFLNEQLLLSALILGFGLLIHIITALPFVGFFYFFYIKKSFLGREQFKYFWLSGLLPIIFLMILLAHARSESSNLSPFILIDPVWERIIRERTPWILITSWTINNAIFLPIATIILFLVSSWELRNILVNKNKISYLYLLILIPLILYLASFFTVDILKISLFAQLQMSRSLSLWQLVVTLLFTYFAIKNINISANFKNIIYNCILLLIVSFLCLPSIGGRSFEKTHNIYFYILLSLFLLCWSYNNRILFNYRPAKMLLIIAIFLLATALFYSILSRGNISFTNLNTYVYIVVSLVLFFWIQREYNISTSLTNKLLSIPSILLLGISIICLGLFTPKLIYPNYYNPPLIETCNWIKNNTSEQDVFITEPFSRLGSEFRLACYRSIFVSKKDGAQSVFNREYALEWQRRMKIARKSKEDTSVLAEISKQYSVDYIFSDRQLDVKYPLVFKNTKHYIYKLSRY